MQRLLILVCLLAVTFAYAEEKCQSDKSDQCPAAATTKAPFNQDTDWNSATSIYDFHAKDIHGNDVPLEKYKGHVCIIVNVASQCTLTDRNYEGLVQLYEKYKDKEGLRILAFPSNQFGGQEPGTAQEILDFIKKYNVTFDVFEKINVNGEDAHPLWKWLKSRASGFLTDGIKWNFTKFIVDKKGMVVQRYSPQSDPQDLEETLKTYF